MVKRTLTATLLAVLAIGEAFADELVWRDAHRVAGSTPGANSSESMPVGGHDPGFASEKTPVGFASTPANAETATEDTAGMQEADWGPFAGRWRRYAGNPILPEPGACPGPGSILRYDGKLWMFVYNNNGHNTRLAVSEDGRDWQYVHDRPILTAEHPWEGSYALTKAALLIDGVVHLYYAGNQAGVYRTGVAIRE